MALRGFEVSFLDNYVTVREIEESGAKWQRYDVSFDGEYTMETLADSVAMLIVKTRCPASLYNKWLDAFEERLVLSDIEKSELRVYINPSIGLPVPGKAATDIELQGAVAEYLWYEAARSQSTEDEIVDIYEPSLRVTEPGGDGLVVYQMGYESYFFRLWEVKQHDSGLSATRKVTDASKQLNSRGAEYLAKWSTVGQNRDREQPGLSKFYAEIVRKWLEADATARAGVSVSKDSTIAITQRPISIMKRHLPALVIPNQLSALVVSVPNFVDFTKLVQQALWKDI